MKNIPRISLTKTLLSTAVTLIAFAANSILCRFALGEETIDAAGFTIVRLLSGALVLFIIISFRKGGKSEKSKGSWYSGIMLFVYAASFSFAYITLETGTGALILFGTVQVTMILLSITRGNRLHFYEWMGLIVAVSGFIYLVLPGVSAPPLSGFLLMAIAGAAWGIYSLNGKNSINPITDTAYNFLRTIPFTIILLVVSFSFLNYSLYGLLYAAASGGVASGIGYAVWYYALGGLSATQAAVVQLLVPVIAAAGGIIFVSEELTLRLVIASILILGGILIGVLGKNKSPQKLI